MVRVCASDWLLAPGLPLLLVARRRDKRLQEDLDTGRWQVVARRYFIFELAWVGGSWQCCCWYLHNADLLLQCCSLAPLGQLMESREECPDHCAAHCHPQHSDSCLATLQ